MSLTRPQDIGWIEALIAGGLLSRSALLACLAREKNEFEALQASLTGPYCQLSHGRLQLRETPPETLPPEPVLSRCLLLDETRGAPLHVEPLPAGTGLILAPAGLRLAGADDLKSDWLRLSSMLSPADRHAGQDSDLQVTDSLLVLSTRQAGTLQIFERAQPDAQATRLTLRSPGGTSCLNLSQDTRLKRLLLTDSTSTRLVCLWLNSGRLERIHPGLGLLGNLQVTPDQEHLLILLLKPVEELLCLRLSDWRVRKRIPLRGHLSRQQGNLSGDPLLLYPDQRHLLIMSWQSGDPPQPLLSTLDLHSLKIVEEQLAQAVPAPLQLAWGRPNPLRRYQQRSLQEILLEAGLITPELLHYQPPHGPQAQRPPLVLRQPLPGMQKPPAAGPPAAETD